MVLTKETAMDVWQQLAIVRRPITKERRTAIIARLMKQKHKKGVNPEDWNYVHYNLLLVAEFDLDLCEAFSLYVEYTSIIRPMITVSKTDIHAQKRAYDRTLRGWPEGYAKWFAELVNDGLTVGAVSRSDGKEKESVFEKDEFKNGKQVKWKHLHFQVRG
jgi:hypothetical protein